MFGVSSPTATIRADVLQAFANAGAGLPVMAISQNPGQAPNPNDLYDQCFNGNVQGWINDLTAAGKTAVRGESIGSYVFDATLAGSAPVYRPDPTDQAALTGQLRTALAGVKSCSFDLGEDQVQVDLSRTDLGQLAHSGNSRPTSPCSRKSEARSSEGSRYHSGVRTNGYAHR